MFIGRGLGWLSYRCMRDKSDPVYGPMKGDSLYHGPPHPPKTHKTAYVVAAVLAAALLTFAALGAMHGVFGKGAETFINKTAPHTWNHTIVPLAKSPPFDLVLAAVGGSLTTLAIVGIASKCRKKRPSYYH